MTHKFVSTSTQYLSVDQAATVGYPCTLAAWINPSVLSGLKTAVFIGDKDNNNRWSVIGNNGNVATAFSSDYISADEIISPGRAVRGRPCQVNSTVAGSPGARMAPMIARPPPIHLAHFLLLSES